MTLADYFRSQRTLTQEEVDHRTAMHDLDDLSPFERLPEDTLSMHRIEAER